MGGKSMPNRILLAISVVILLTSTLFFIGCDSDSSSPQSLENTALKLRPNNLPTLTEDFGVVYELWVVDTLNEETTLVSLGQFFWDTYSFHFKNKYGYNRSDIFNLPTGKTTEDYNMMYISIEPYPDPSKEMSASNLLEGPIREVYPINLIEMHARFSPLLDLWESEGSFVVATITDFNLDKDDEAAKETSGVWFTYVETGNPFVYEDLQIGLIIPTIPEDYNMIYEGWVFKEGWRRPLSLGKFRNPNYRDLDNPYIDDKYAPLVPGEDFLNDKKSPSWIDFPLNLIGEITDQTSEVFVTIEPYPDPDPVNPFPLVLLSRNLPLLQNENDTPDRRVQTRMVLGKRYINLPTIEVTRAIAERK
jgi:hypothetical protein